MCGGAILRTSYDFNMVNSQVTQEIINALKLNIQRENIPNPIPVVEVGMKKTKNIESRYLLNTNSTGATIFTASTTKDTYLVGATLSMTRDVTATSTLHEIRYTDTSGATRRLIGMACITLTAGTKEAVISLPQPILLQKGSNVTVNSSTNVANFNLACNVFFYEDDASGA